MLDFRVETFLKVCQTMNYTRAAEALSITQPAVSQHISYLEKHYGTRLFSYRGKRLFLTEQGELLRRTLEGIAHDERILADRLKTMGDDCSVRVRIGMTLTAGEYLVAAPLADYLAEHPNMRVDVHSGDTARLLKMLDEGDIDCAFVEGFFDKSEYAWDTFCTERFACVCASGHDFARTPHSLEDLLGEHVLLREKGSGTRAVLEHALAARNLSADGFAQVSEVGSLGVIKVMVEHDLGITFMYEAAVQSRVAEGALRIVHLRETPMEHDISFIRLKGSAFEDDFRALFQGLKACRKRIIAR